jgi:choline dehydrogenase-like flavoprotein
VTIHKLVEATVPSTSVSSTVCIVGAGFAGLIAALRLAREASVRVVIVESAIDKDDPATLALDAIDNPAGNYDGNLRSRGLGGTSLRWDGKLLPISSGEMGERPWIDLPAWPFNVTELDCYTSEIEALLGVDRASYEEDVASLLDTDGLLPRGDADFTQRWPKRPALADRNLARVLHDEIATHENLDIRLGATVSAFAFDEHSRRLDSIVAIDHHRHTLAVTANEFLIAAGALESTRLMLVADRQSGGVISRETDALGRYFNDHFGLKAATVRPIDRRRTNRAFADRWVLGGNRHLHFELMPAAQQAGHIGSAYFDFSVDVPETSAVTQARLAVQACRSGRIGAAFRPALAALVDLPTLVNTVLWRYLAKLKYWPTSSDVQLTIRIEQLPDRSNRIILSDAVDALGQPLMRFEFRKTDADERAFRFTVEKIRAYWERHMSGLAALDWIPAVADAGGRLADQSVELAHPAGATRMGIDPAQSVVDPWLRVHRVPNLSIASSSVFPASGSANPTFTIMHLAMRAADAILTRLKPQRLAHGEQSQHHDFN